MHYYYYPTLCLCSLLLTSAVAAAPAHPNPATITITNPNLNALMFYTCVTPQIGNQCQEGFTLDQVGIATGGFSSNLTTIAQGAKLGNMTTLYAVHDTFFDNGSGLRQDWKQAWSALQVQIEPYIKSKVIVGFFIGDELFPGKISFSDFTTALQAVQTMKTKYPWLVNWENEGGTSWVDDFKEHGVPVELDIISTDDYYMWDNNDKPRRSPQSQVDGHRQFYEQSIYPLLKPHQKVYLVPGSYATHDTKTYSPAKYPQGNLSYCYNTSYASCDQWMADQANAFAQWAYEDQRIAGIAPWHWDTRNIGVVTPYKEVGVVDMPLTKAAWTNIGSAIRGANEHRSRARVAQTTVPHNASCTTQNIPLESYHIHILFPASDANKTNAALELQLEFMQEFNLVGKHNCTMHAGDPAPLVNDLCAFEIDWEPAGPFPTAQYSFFVPRAWLTKTTTWMVEHRGNLDMLVHPNSGCEVEDHAQWGFWSGTKWELDLSIFSCEYPGCVPQS